MRKTLVLLTLAACTQPVDRFATVDQASTFGTKWPTDGTLAAGSNNDWWGAGAWCSYSVNMCRLVGNASGSTLTGLDSSKTGCDIALQFYNAGAYDITVAHNSSLSTGADQIALKTGAAEVLHPGYTMFLAVPCTSGSPAQWYEFGEYSAPPYSPPAAPVLAVTPSTPSRSLGTAFRPSTSSVTSVHYSVQIDSTISVTGGAAGRVELLSDSSNPPTTIRASVPGGLTGTALLGMSVVSTAGGELSYDVPAGDYVLLRSVTVTGTPTYTITQQVEEAWSL